MSGLFGVRHPASLGSHRLQGAQQRPRARRVAAALMMSLLAVATPLRAEEALTAIGVLRTTSIVLDRASAKVVPASVAALHADLKFSVTTPARANASDDTAPAAVLTRQAQRLAPALEVAARGLHPAMMERIGKFDVYVADSTNVETRSSSTGKVALHAGLAPLLLTDDALAFVIAREMGHVLAGHQEDNSTASLVTSIVMNVLLPGSSLLKSAISIATSEAVSASNGERQVREADEIAVRLLETAGYRMRNLGLSLALDAADERMGEGSWAKAFRTSAAGIVAKSRRGTSPADSLAAVSPVMYVAANVVAAEAAILAAPVTATPVTPALAVTAVSAAAQSSAHQSTQQSAQQSTHQSAHHSAGTASAADPATRLKLSLEPAIRARPSGIAGPLLLGGYTVPLRQID